jgi:nucleotide-binding universal stress UspA family protein
MKILLAYDGSECADAALDDLRRAGLPSDAQIKSSAVAARNHCSVEVARKTEERRV